MKYSFGCHFPVRAECRSIDPLFLIAVFLVGSYVSWGQGLVDSLSDFFVVGVGQVSQRVEVQRVRAALSTLNEAQRLAISLKLGQDMHTAEIAADDTPGGAM